MGFYPFMLSWCHRRSRRLRIVRRLWRTRRSRHSYSSHFNPQFFIFDFRRYNKRNYRSPRHELELSCPAKTSSHALPGLFRRFGIPRRSCLHCPGHELPSCFCCHNTDCHKVVIRIVLTCFNLPLIRNSRIYFYHNQFFLSTRCSRINRQRQFG